MEMKIKGFKCPKKYFQHFKREMKYNIPCLNTCLLVNHPIVEFWQENHGIMLYLKGIPQHVVCFHLYCSLGCGSCSQGQSVHNSPSSVNLCASVRLKLFLCLHHKQGARISSTFPLFGFWHRYLTLVCLYPLPSSRPGRYPT